MGHRVLSTEETLRYLDKVKAFHDGNAQKPAYIDAWRAKIDETIQHYESALQQGLFVQGDDTFKRVVHGLAAMRFKKDRLYGYWMNDTFYRSWNELATGTMPTADELFFLTVTETEDYFTEPHGVATFVQHLDQVHVPGVMKDFVYACLRDCDALLTKEVTLTPEIMHTFLQPEQVFGTSTKEVLEERLNNWCRNMLPSPASLHVQRIFIANVLAAQGNFLAACLHMECARAEATEPHFAEYLTTGNPLAHTHLFATQRWMIDMLFSVWHRGA